jgi:transglutaminase-like putative cysteine protease
LVKKYSRTTLSSNRETVFLIRHQTRFIYDEPACDSHNEVRLKPRESPDQRTLGFRLDTIPATAVIEYVDAFGNTVHALSIAEPHRELLVISDLLVQRLAPPSLDRDGETIGEFLASDHLRAQEHYDFLHQSHYIPFSEQLKKFFWMIKPLMKELVAQYTMRVIGWVYGQFAYEPGTTHVHSDVNRILAVGAGVCQDFAHLSIGILRLAGVPARYVSGYLAPKVSPGDPPPSTDQATHAWVEAMLPGVGWMGFDPTHGCVVTDHYVRLAVGRDYADVPPLRGVYRSSGTRQTMRVTLDIRETDPPAAPDVGSGEQ